MPIITCKGNRKGKVAQEITSKGYCATKKTHYFGVKLHCLALRRCSALPLPNALFITPTNTHDLTAMRNILEQIQVSPVVLDKAYSDKSLANRMLENKSELITPIKEQKGATENMKQFDRVFNEKYNTAVSKIRQPIESFFNWINEKTQIQIASKVRSDNGLIVHVFGKLAAIMLLLR
ncbi:transposase [Flammeovirga aprica]|uniref:Transposase n=1 Tax=Flammeovirga aprica JL-4 TaxID=694437 RepID=A0A7X9S1W0_9BACT|nr:transposase [Flammeovirga aprica]NME72870.1 transposase [Flammeovirga aprica JL-4]